MNRIQEFFGKLGVQLARMGRWAAGFTFWQFVLFSFLVLIAANLLNNLVISEKVVTKTRSAPTAPAVRPAPTSESPSAPGAEAIPAPAAEASAPATAPPAVSAVPDKEMTAAEVKIGPQGISIHDKKTGESVNINWDELSVRPGKKPAAEETSPQEDEADEEETVTTSHKEGFSFGKLALVVLALLWIMRFVIRSRAKADARADQAEQVAERETLERQVAEARLQTLQAQVEPHFLFNTLGAVEHLIETDPRRAGEMQRHLIAYLRGAMPQMRDTAPRPLSDEVELCRNYLAIMKIRMEDRLSYTIDLPEELKGATFPPMMLQSVVENAIKHGLEPKADGGSLVISARSAAGRLRVTVADSGLGFGAAQTSGTGIGLENIRQRLRGLFGDNAALVIAPNAPTGAQVTIEIPHDGSNGNSGR